jgi:hypothetical protein
MSSIVDRLGGELPLRVTHNDTKLNNVLIDNETGKTYSLSSLPYIYSVQNGIIVTKTDKSETLYQPKIDENGELVFEAL